MRAFLPVSLAAALALSSVAPGASAQNQQPPDVYHFEEDDLIGATMATTPPLLLVRTKRPRVMLLRPRASFVPELVTSVETL